LDVDVRVTYSKMFPGLRGRYVKGQRLDASPTVIAGRLVAANLMRHELRGGWKISTECSGTAITKSLHSVPSKFRGELINFSVMRLRTSAFVYLQNEVFVLTSGKQSDVGDADGQP
jgi:hypothetical protein